MRLGAQRKLITFGEEGTLGTFAGVFTPSILTILGIILFLRLGYVVGNAGLGQALVIIGLANAISIFTSVSLSAIATNLKVKGGGDYYLISRTLGVEFGGAIGVVLFLAQSVSIAFYCIGFGEAVSGLLKGSPAFLPQIIAALAIAFLFVFAWLGTDWATRFQYVVMSILAAAIASFFIGGLNKWDNATLVQNWASPSASPEFWLLFAIFFPAVTGFTQGVSMSGDLKDAGKSLPLGTFAAVGVSIIVYFGAAVVFAAAASQDILISDYRAMEQVASINFIIVAGVIAATLSSAMASFLGAPRILQSMARDRIFPFLLPFAQGFGYTANPRRGVLLSAAIALATISLGKLNVLAPVVSMFFLISYGLINYATYYEARASSPSFRPRFRWFDTRLSLLGCLACGGAMLAIDLTAGVLAISVLFAIFQYLKRTAGPARWADSRRSYHLHQLREHLLAAASEPEHPRDWRPQLLAFSDDPRRREWLLRFTSWVEGGSGLTTVVNILEGEGAKMVKLREEVEKELRSSLAEYDIKALPLVVVAPKIRDALQTLVQAFGIGPLKVNTICINWIEQGSKEFFGLRELRYGRNLRTAFRLGCNIIVFDAKEDEWATLEALPNKERRIDVWWWGDATSRLALLLAYLITRNNEWEEASIRVMATDYEKKTKKTTEELHKIIEEVRIDAEPKVILNVSADKILKLSSDAALVFIPIRLWRNQILDPFGEKIEAILPGLPLVALVLAAEDIDLDAAPEEGKAGETAEVLDAFEDAEKKARKKEKEAIEAAEIAEEQQRKMQEAVLSGTDETEMKKIEEAAIRAQEHANKAARKASKAQAKAEDAAKKVEKLGVKPDKLDKRAKEPSEPEKGKGNGKGNKKNNIKKRND
ncbi:MAG: amino acid permease [Thermodesulfobacteriota bacterium]|nr:amino acid permease [Thermodesulfobacteriota bacterium]